MNPELLRALETFALDALTSTLKTMSPGTPFINMKGYCAFDLVDLSMAIEDATAGADNEEDRLDHDHMTCGQVLDFLRALAPSIKGEVGIRGE